MTSLAETQALLWRLITAPEGAAAAAKPGGLEGVVAGDERLSAAVRVDVYGCMYFSRIQDAIRENFPAVAAALDRIGETAFRDLVVDYLELHPSRHFSLREIGGRVGEFLRARDSAKHTLWLADLAAFEWAFLGAFDAADAEALGAEALAGVAAEEWVNLRLGFSPSLRVLDLAFAVAESWEQVGKSDLFEPPTLTATRYRLWRREHEVFYRTVDETERAALETAEHGTFGDVCAAVADQVGDEAAPAAAFKILSRWMNDGIVVSVER